MHNLILLSPRLLAFGPLKRLGMGCGRAPLPLRCGSASSASAGGGGERGAAPAMRAGIHPPGWGGGERAVGKKARFGERRRKDVKKNRLG